jgi:heat shock protein HtpX
MRKNIAEYFAAAAFTAAPLAAQDNSDLFSKLDANKDGFVTPDEIKDDQKALYERMLRTSDKDGDKKLSKDEFQAGLKPDETPRQPLPGGGAGIPMPKLYIINESTPNAFATGRNPQHAAVAVTAGLMSILSNDEVEGVIAHELAHVKNRDILIGTIAATLAAAIMRLSWMGMFFGGRSDDDEGGSAFGGILLLIFGWIASMIIQMWISRTREYAADAAGAKISGKPLALANALLKLESGVQVAPMQAEPATAHMFIVNPFSGGRAAGFVANLFSTHPPIPERVARLQAMADDMQYPSITR